jgi:hypothetical protein
MPPGGTTFAGSFTVHVDPPLPEDARLSVTVVPAAGTRPRIVRCGLNGVGRKLPEPVEVPFVGSQQFAVVLERDPKKPRESRDVTFTFESADAQFPDEVIKGTLVSVDLTVRPRVPVENEARLAR